MAACRRTASTRFLPWPATACRLVAVAVLVVAAGCSGGGTKAKRAKSADAPGRAAESETLPALDPDTTIVVDDGRIAITSPAGWMRAGRSKDYLLRYKPGAKKTFPAIVVTVAEPPDGFAEVTAANQAAFVERIAADLAESFSTDGKSTLLKKPAAVQIGPHAAVGWTAPGTEKIGSLDERIERASFAVVVGGRMYTVEARGPKGKLDAAARLTAKAVAAGLAVPAVEAPAEPAAPAQEDGPPAEPTSDEKPAADEKKAA